MADENRRVVAATHDHARALADNLRNQGYEVVSVEPAHWVLRRTRRRMTSVVTIAVRASPDPTNWAPPTGPPAT